MRFLKKIFGKGEKPSEFVDTGKPVEAAAEDPARRNFYAELAAQESERAALMGTDKVESPENIERMLKAIIQRTNADIKVTRAAETPMLPSDASVAVGEGMAVAQDAAPAGYVQGGGLTDEQQQMLSNVDLYQIYGRIDPRILRHFVSRAFIGYPACTILGQHEVIGACCSMPAEDAIASGFFLDCTSDDHDDGDEHIEAESSWLEGLRDRAVEEGAVKTCIKFGTYTRLYGIGVAIPRVELAGKHTFEEPYDPKFVKPGSFKGFTVIDPSRIAWDFTADTLWNPFSEWYQKPEFLRLVTATPSTTHGLGEERRIHRSWCITSNYREVGEDLLATYMYGGMPLSQLLYERVFCADTLANEIVALAMSKRTVVMERNGQELLMEPAKVSHFLERINFFRTNNSVLFKEPGLNVQQLETSLADLQPLSAQQYQYAAAIAGIPVTKLLKNVPSGLQATGQYQIEDYEETVKPIRKDFTELLNRWFELRIASDYPDREDLVVSVKFNPFVTPKAQEVQQIASQKSSMVCQLLMNHLITVTEGRGILKQGESDVFNLLEDKTPEILKKIENANDPDEKMKMQQQMQGAQMQGGGAPMGGQPPTNPQLEANKGMFQKILSEISGGEGQPGKEGAEAGVGQGAEQEGPNEQQPAAETPAQGQPNADQNAGSEQAAQ